MERIMLQSRIVGWICRVTAQIIQLHGLLTTTAPQAAGVDLQGGSSSLGDLPAAGAVAPTTEPQSSPSVTQPGVQQQRILQGCSVVN